MKKSSNLALAILLLANFSLLLTLVDSHAQTKRMPNQTLSAREIAKSALPSVVLVLAQGEEDGLGSGFFVDSDLIATNYHVIKGAYKIQAFSIGNEQPFTVRLIRVDKANDIALLKVFGIKGKPLPLGEKTNIEIGDIAYAVGNPKGLEGTFSNGIVSSIRDNGDIQITTPISPGSSGGPVLNERGQVIGIATYFLRGGQNLNFAKPSKHLLSLINSVKQENETGKKNDIAAFLEITKKAEALTALGEKESDKNNYLSAIQYYQEALELDPSFARAYFKMAQSYMLLGNSDMAFPLFRKAVKLSPSNPTYRFLLGMYYCRYQAESAAFEEYDALVKLNSNLQDSLKTIICTYFSSSKAKYFCTNE